MARIASCSDRVVSRERVDGYHRRDAERSHVLDLLGRLSPPNITLVTVDTGWQRLARPDVVPATVRLQRPHGRHEHRGIRDQP
jgi:hypothetical protein